VLWGIYALAIGTGLGVAGELAVSGYGLWRRGRRLIPRWYGFDRSLRKVLAQYAPMVVGAVLMGSTVLVDQAMAAMLGSGSVAALNYANKLLAMILNIGLSSLSIAVLPSFSTLSAQEDWRAMRRVLIHYTWIIAFVTVPLTFLIIKYSEPLIGFVFQGGAFTAQDVHLVAHVQTLLCLQLPFFSIGVLYVRAISSLKRNQILMWGTIINVTVNVVLNYVFMKMFGLAGIALSTSAVYAISCCYLCWMLVRSLRELESASRQPSYAIASADSAI
jgi:putative peptidoglycan lipid II flippase